MKTKVLRDKYCTTINHSEGVEVVVELGKNKLESFCNVIDVSAGTVKPIDPNFLISGLLNSYQKNTVRTGRIPGSQFILDLSMDDTNNSKHVITFVKAGIVNIKTSGRVFNRIKLPPMLFNYRLEGIPCKIKSTRIMCLKGINEAEQIKSSTQLYQYPLMHVSTDGVPCWGNIALPTINNLDNLMYIPGLFFNAEMDVKHGGNRDKNSRKLPIVALLDKAESGELILEDVLLPTNKTFEEFSNTFLGRN